MNGTVKIKKLSPQAQIPTYGTVASAGADLYYCGDSPITIQPGETFLLPTGLSMEIPEGYVGLIFARSSLGTKRGLAPANKVGVIDSDYRGEIKVSLYNHGRSAQTIEPNDRIAQILFTSYLHADFQLEDELEKTERGSGGFGSTGK